MLRRALVILLCPSLAFAVECESDDDCGEHETCALVEVAVAAPCYIDEDGQEQCEVETTIEPSVGTCRPAPIPCETDADCPGISSCVERSVGRTTEDCAASSDGGEFDCGPAEDSDSTMAYCEFVPRPCDSNTTCAEGLACTEIGTSCTPTQTLVEPDCPEGDSCPEPDARGVEDACDDDMPEYLCLPQEIPCEVDEVCPSGWSCEEVVVAQSCGTSGGEASSSSGMSAGSAGSSDEQSDAPPPSEPGDGQDPELPSDSSSMDASEDGGEDTTDVPDSACETIVQSYCLPEGYQHYFGGIAGGIETSLDASARSGSAGTTGQSEEQSDGGELSPSSENESAVPTSNSDSGCDCTFSESRHLAFWHLLLVCYFFRRRRDG